MRTNERIAAVAFAVIASCILVAAGSVTLLARDGHQSFLRLPFRAMCHSLPERSLQITGSPMPLCARCTGIYCGMLLGIGLACALRRRLRFNGVALSVAATPFLLDGTTQAAGLRLSSNDLRFATGTLMGMAFLLYIMRRLFAARQSSATLEVAEALNLDAYQRMGYASTGSDHVNDPSASAGFKARS